MVTFRKMLGVLTGVLLIITGCGTGEDATAIANLGHPVPDIGLERTDGTVWNLEAFKGKPILIVFVDLNPEQRSASVDHSRTQTNFAKSIAHQYRDQDLVTVMIDSTDADISKKQRREAAINFKYDWKLQEIPVLLDMKGKAARQFGIERLPTVLLIDPEGKLDRKWEGLTLTSTVALRLEELIGPPSFRE